MNTPLFMIETTNTLCLGHGLSSMTQYDLTALKLHIPIKYCDKAQKILLVLESEDGLKDLVELNFLENQNPYKIYIPSVLYPIRINTGKITISILLLTENNDCIFSKPLKLNIAIDNYRFARDISLMNSLNTSLSQYYEKIVQLLMKLSQEGEENYDS